MNKDTNAAAKKLVQREVAKLDLKKYRTGELTQELTELISIPGAILKVFVTTIQVTLVVVVVVLLMLFFVEASGLEWFFTSIYSLVMAVIAGFVLGLIRVVYRSLGNIEQILRLILGIAQNVAEDAGQLQSGEVRAPSGSELVAQVYDDVVAPTLQKVVAGVFGWFGGPLYWVYNRTINASIKMVLKRTQMPQLSEEEDAAIAQGFESGVVESSRYSQQIQSFTDQAAGIVGSIGGGIRSYVMRPIFVVYCVLLMIAALPILIFRFFSGWKATPSEEKLIDDAQQMVSMISSVLLDLF